MAKAIIQRYDPAVTKAPYTFITIDEIEFDDKHANHPDLTGREYYDLFHNKMRELGYKFKSCSGGYNGIPYYITVH